MNLMLNGIDAMKDMNAEGELTIKSQQAEDDQLLISVSDTGVCRLTHNPGYQPLTAKEQSACCDTNRGIL